MYKLNISWIDDVKYFEYEGNYYRVDELVSLHRILDDAIELLAISCEMDISIRETRIKLMDFIKQVSRAYGFRDSVTMVLDSNSLFKIETLLTLNNRYRDIKYEILHPNN